MPERTAVVLGIDYGKRRIGLATGNTLTGTARSLSTVNHHGAPMKDIDPIIESWNPGCIIIGLPLSTEGSETESSRAARAFAADLQARHPGRRIEFQDERYSSRMADSQFAQARQEGRARRRDARSLDGVAAAIIVESWLAANRVANASEPGT